MFYASFTWKFNGQLPISRLSSDMANSNKKTICKFNEKTCKVNKQHKYTQKYKINIWTRLIAIV